MSTNPDRADRLLPENSVWIHGMKWWHIGFYTALAAVVIVVLNGEPNPSVRAMILGAMALLAAAYPFLTRQRYLDTWRPVAYVVLLVLVVGFLAFLPGSGAVLLFVAFPQIWMFSATARAGLISTAAICVAVALGQLSRFSGASEDLVGIGLQAGLSFLASTMLGLWIYKIIDQSEDRAQLLAELNAARAELQLADQRQGAMAERERMSREIHDTLAQGFTSVVMLSEAALAQLRTARPETGARQDLTTRLETINATARDNLQEARALIASTGPSQLQGGDLLGALERLAAAATQGGIETSCTLPEKLPNLTSNQQIALLRSAQEGLTNIRKHAAASRAHLTLDRAGTELHLTVTDDGVGFDPGLDTSGYGLQSISARLGEIGGQLTIHTAVGAGTTLGMVVPVTENGTTPGPRPAPETTAFGEPHQEEAAHRESKIRSAQVTTPEAKARAEA
ncbi:sensor histidine kinase [Arthrobacter sp. CAN_C5]|uniref:sensor histidine kinase n=1 Tax=Arthrobacter sp. CAN_C5 TaxID=2760706 RepID=UPI001AEA1FF8|nr:sensor histidine kinase [Arthrobacter sp. CAN_C5]MBP2215660.1 signal transduction histidine kinase [Arthrobacter sp. CAN_C5]